MYIDQWWCMTHRRAKIWEDSSIILKAICQMKMLQKCFGDYTTLFYVAQQFTVTNKYGLMTI